MSKRRGYVPSALFRPYVLLLNFAQVKQSLVKKERRRERTGGIRFIPQCINTIYECYDCCSILLASRIRSLSDSVRVYTLRLVVKVWNYVVGISLERRALPILFQGLCEDWSIGRSNKKVFFMHTRLLKGPALMRS